MNRRELLKSTTGAAIAALFAGSVPAEAAGVVFPVSEEAIARARVEAMRSWVWCIDRGMKGMEDKYRPGPIRIMFDTNLNDGRWAAFCWRICDAVPELKSLRVYLPGKTTADEVTVFEWGQVW